MSDRKYSSLWKRAKRLEEKCARAQTVASEFLPTNVSPPCPSLLSQELAQEEGSIKQNSADDRDLDDLISQSSSRETNLPLRHSIAQWTHDFHIKHNAVDSLLKILIENGHPELPRTAKTLLATNEIVEFEMKSGMQYVYLGCKFH